MLLRSFLPWVALCATATAEVLELELKAGKTLPLSIRSAVDDSTFAEPRGYAVHGQRSRSFLERIELTNTSEKPLIGRLVMIDDRDFSSMDGLTRTLGLSREPEHHARSMEKLFTFWKDHRSHAGTGLPLANEPFATLNFWGYTLCGEDTQALARLAHGLGIPARYVQLNGHIAGEYRYDGDWHVVDGDQNAVYLELDNQTLASAEDLRKDPFLVLRTKVFGKHSPLEIAASAFNSGLIEHVEPAEPKPLKVKTGPAPLNAFTIHPGEAVIWHANLPPEKPVGKLITEKADVLRGAALITIEHRAVAKNYKASEEGTVAVTSPFPIWKAVNKTTGVVFEPKPDEVVFKASLAIKSESDELVIFSQASRNALPSVRRGENMVKLDAQNGAARVTFHYKGQPKLTPPSVSAKTKTATFQGPPSFTIANATPSKPDRLWWQIATTRDFTFVAPSLEGVSPWAPELRFDLVTDTFLNPAKTYFFRVKARADGVWGEWSEQVPFKVNKPVSPADLAAEKIGARLRLNWQSVASDCEYLIFGSNRRDFVPEIYAETEIVAMDHLKILKERANENLVTKTTETSAEFVPEHRFFRVVAKKGTAYSVPTALIDIGTDFKLPPAKVLQVRAKNEGGKDFYSAQETETK